MASKKKPKTPAQKTWTRSALQALTNAWLAKGNAPTQGMIDQGLVKANQTPNAAAQPFLTGEQVLGKTDAQTQHDAQVQDLQNQLAQAVLAAKGQREDIERGRTHGLSSAQDDAAARGIFQSSIKDGQIFDINAQAAAQQQRLTDQLSALQTSVTSRINLLDEALRRTQAAFDQMAVENASQIDTGYTTTYQSANPNPVQPRRPAAPRRRPVPYSARSGFLTGMRRAAARR